MARKGWSGESARHSLAARGMKTSCPRKSITKKQTDALNEAKYELATKVGAGRERLTKEELEMAKDFGYFDRSLKYEQLDALWYEGHDQAGKPTQGYLHVEKGKIHQRSSKARGTGKPGERIESYCVLGWLHREEIDKKYLSPKQKELW